MKLNFNTPINQLGMGLTGWNLFRGLINLGVETSLFPISKVDLPPNEYLKRGLDNAKHYDKSAPALKLWHAWDFSFPFKVEGKKIGWTFFELDRLTPKEVEGIKQLDSLILSSVWAQEIVKAAKTGVQTFVVPLGVNINVFKSAEKPRGENLVFLTVGKMERRKGLDILPEIFNRAFTKEDKVELQLLVDNPFHNAQETQKWRRLYLSTPLAQKVKFLPRQKTQEDVCRIMRAADVGIFPSRGEGWNQPLLEMMSCNKSVITTNYSAHTEYCTTENSHLIEIDELEDAHDQKWFFGQGKWAKLGEKQINQAVDYMRGLYERWKKGESLTNAAGVETAKKLTWENSARTLLEVIK